MEKTYEDSSGTQYKTWQEAADANKAMGTNPAVNNELLKSSGSLNIQPPAPATGAVGESAGIETISQANKDDYTRQLEQKSKQAEASKTSSMQSYLDSVVNQKGEAQQTQEAYQETVDPAEAELIDITNQIDAEVQSNRRKIQALEKNPGGLFGGALATEITRINNESLAKQADLSVIQLAKQRRYDSAKAQADRAVSVKLEQQRNALEAKRIQYEDNKSMFTTAEQRAFEAKQADRERELNRQEEELKNVSSMAITALQNGAPTSTVSRMQQAKTVADAIKIGGQYMMTWQDKKARAEYNSIVNPPAGVVVPESVKDLKDTTREKFTEARATIKEVDEIIQIINRNPGNFAELEAGIGDDAMRFRQLRANVVDKLARERTGAVIGKDEKRDFKKILGVGARQLAIKDTQDVVNGLEQFKNKHSETTLLIDPDGSISKFMDESLPANITNSIINQQLQNSSGSNTLDSYTK